MTENYFENLRTVGASLDDGINKLQSIWEMPNLILCSKNEKDQLTARKTVDNLQNELQLLRNAIKVDNTAVKHVIEKQSQLLDETTDQIQRLKEGVSDIKIVFEENGYVEEPFDNNLSIINSKLESVCMNNTNSITNDPAVSTQSSLYNNISFSKPIATINKSLNDSSRKLLLNERLMEPIYSPSCYKIMKKT